MILGTARWSPVFVELCNDPAANEVGKAVLLRNRDFPDALRREHVGFGPESIERTGNHREGPVLAIAEDVGRDPVAAIVRLAAIELDGGRQWLASLEPLHDIGVAGPPK